MPWPRYSQHLPVVQHLRYLFFSFDEIFKHSPLYIKDFTSSIYQSLLQVDFWYVHIIVFLLAFWVLVVFPWFLLADFQFLVIIRRVSLICLVYSSILSIAESTQSSILISSFLLFLTDSLFRLSTVCHVWWLLWFSCFMVQISGFHSHPA